MVINGSFCPATQQLHLVRQKWSKALLLEKWMTNAVQCCEEAGIAPPASALQLVACSPPLLTPSPPSSIITPPPPPHIPGGVVEQDEVGRDVKNLCEICYGEMRSWELQEHGGASCKHQFCATCWESYLSLKIQEGGAHHILCPAVRCNILVDVDFIEKMVSPEIARKYLQFDIQCKFDFCWVCLESWKKHSSATGGYFRCNRFDAQSKADEKLGVMLSEVSVVLHLLLLLLLPLLPLLRLIVTATSTLLCSISAASPCFFISFLFQTMFRFFFTYLSLTIKFTYTVQFQS
ncbi:Ankyrin repeat and IBR domain-containing protein 1 [Portunus trituberculatus]|uniref:RBR-type E3 ubiquitin transferase n=1 Tax=Portunus trituberculatus TaxID=210409 RepID=A0A5B7G415_PORTR|nr:Ankyrin repeat and IBR domain-containing protein 1 [Portunus trituberculatus]